MSLTHPTTVAYRDIDLSWIVGRSVVALSFRQSARWLLSFGSDADISIECLWRIIQSERIVLTSEDHEQKFGLPAPLNASARGEALLAGKFVTSAQLREATADIILTFEHELKMEILSTSAGYESWQLRDPKGMSYVAQGGGQLCTWKA